MIKSNKTSSDRSDAAGVLLTVGDASCYNTTARRTVSLAATSGKEEVWFLSELSQPTSEKESHFGSAQGEDKTSTGKLLLFISSMGPRRADNTANVLICINPSSH